MDERSSAAKIMPTTADVTLDDRLDHFLARWGYRRAYHRVEPGLYSLGNPTPDSPVFVTANYTLSFDALRSNLAGVDGYILVLDTKGINVWCAAGKGTFGTEELMGRIKATGLESVVRHRNVILPQLGASGISAYSLTEWSGWHAEYGPVRASDLPGFLKAHKATPEMRRVRFTLWDRIQLIPIELVSVLLYMVIAAAVLFFVTGPAAAMAVLAAVLAGVVLFPIVLPYIPVKDFSAKGLALGLVVALPFAYYMITRPGLAWPNALAALGYILMMPPVTAFLTLNFTGSSTFTSRTGVRKEIYKYIPPMAVTFALGALIFIGLLAGRFMKVI